MTHLISLIALYCLIIVTSAAEGVAQVPASIFYMEERPLELTIEVSISAGGEASVSVTGLKPDCPEGWEKRCWTKSTRQVRLTDKEYRRLLDLIAGANLNSIPQEKTTMPGGSRMHIVVNASGVQKIDVTASLAKAEQNAGFRLVRAAILQIAGPIEGNF